MKLKIDSSGYCCSYCNLVTHVLCLTAKRFFIFTVISITICKNCLETWLTLEDDNEVITHNGRCHVCKRCSTLLQLADDIGICRDCARKAIKKLNDKYCNFTPEQEKILYQTAQKINSKYCERI